MNSFSTLAVTDGQKTEKESEQREIAGYENVSGHAENVATSLIGAEGGEIQIGDTNSLSEVEIEISFSIENELSQRGEGQSRTERYQKDFP